MSGNLIHKRGDNYSYKEFLEDAYIALFLLIRTKLEVNKPFPREIYLDEM